MSNMPTWEELDAYFNPDENEMLHEFRSAFMRAHPEEADTPEGDLEEYRTVFLSVYEIQLEDSLVQLLEGLEKSLGRSIFSVDYHDDDEQLLVKYKDNIHIFYDYPKSADDFEEAISQLEAILESTYVFRYFRDGVFHSDLEILVLPADWWTTLESQYGKEYVQYFWLPVDKAFPYPPLDCPPPIVTQQHCETAGISLQRQKPGIPYHLLSTAIKWIVPLVLIVFLIVSLLPS